MRRHTTRSRLEPDAGGIMKRATKGPVIGGDPGFEATVARRRG
jgi:hypothetical protein